MSGTADLTLHGNQSKILAAQGSGAPAPSIDETLVAWLYMGCEVVHYVLRVPKEGGPFAFPVSAASINKRAAFASSSVVARF